MMLGAWDPCDNPTSQSLLADYYPTVQRSKVMSVYQTGQLLGILLVPIAAAMATQWGWRSAFYFLGIPAFIVAILARRLPEPVRGQQDRVQQQLDARLSQPVGVRHDARPPGLPRAVPRPHVHPARACRRGSARCSSGASARGRRRSSSATTTCRSRRRPPRLSLLALGGLAGVLLSGWLADYLTFRGFRAGRVLVGGVARLISFPLFVLTFVISNTPIMLVTFTLAAMCLVAPQAPMNAARADVLHARLRGRGTAIDVVLQSVCAAIAPTLVGVLADAYSLRAAFLVLVPLMAVSGVLLLLAVAAVHPRGASPAARSCAPRRSPTEDAEPDDDSTGDGPTVSPPNRSVTEPAPTVR